MLQTGQEIGIMLEWLWNHSIYIETGAIFIGIFYSNIKKSISFIKAKIIKLATKIKNHNGHNILF